MMRVAIAGSFHESNHFVLEKNDQPTAMLESPLHLGARLALAIRDANAKRAAMRASVGATLTLEVGASID